MPFTRGTPKPPGSGRKKGNGTKQYRGTVEQILAEHDCNPIAGLADIAKDKAIEPGVRVRAYGELAQYVYPKRRAIELSGPEGGPIEHDINPTDLLEQRLEDLAGRADSAEPVQGAMDGAEAGGDSPGGNP